MCPREAAAAIRELGDFDLKRIHEIESEVKHDVIAFTTAVAEKMAAAAREASRWLHYGLTSNDVVDTAQALQLKEASGHAAPGSWRLQEVLKRRALEFQHTPYDRPHARRPRGADHLRTEAAELV